MTTLCVQTQARAARKFDAYLQGAKGSNSRETAMPTNKTSDLGKTAPIAGGSKKSKNKQMEHIGQADVITSALQMAAQVSNSMANQNHFKLLLEFIYLHNCSYRERKVFVQYVHAGRDTSRKSNGAYPQFTDFLSYSRQASER